MSAATRSENTRAEAYRSLRSTIKFAAGDTPVRSVLIVDTDRTGASETAFQVARAFAKAGDSCAFINTDPASGNTGIPGLSDLLIGSTSLDEVLQGDTGDGLLTVIGPGTVADPDLLAGGQLARVLEALQQRFDYIIFGAAGLPGSSDAISVAPRVDATILVVTSGKTRRAKAVQARDALQRVGANILGVVLVESKRRLFW